MKNVTMSLPRPAAKTDTTNLHMRLRKAAALVVMGFLAGRILAQQPSPEGADLFAPSSQAGKKLDVQRALPMTSFYATAGLKTAEPGTLVRSEPAKDYALPSGVTATRILYHTTASGSHRRDATTRN